MKSYNEHKDSETTVDSGVLQWMHRFGNGRTRRQKTTEILWIDGGVLQWIHRFRNDHRNPAIDDRGLVGSRWNPSMDVDSEVLVKIEVIWVEVKS